VNGETENKEAMQGEPEVVRWKGESFTVGQKEKSEAQKFEPKQAPRTPNLKSVIACIDNFYRDNGYAILPHDKKVALAYAIHVQIRKDGLYE